MKKIILAAAGLLTISSAAMAQTSANATQTVNLILANTIELTFTGSGTATGTTVNLPFNTVSDYANGVTSTDQQLKVRSNKNFGVTVKSNSANFTYSGTTSPAPIMPVSGVLGLMVSANGTGGAVAAPFSTSTYATITGSNQNLLNTASNGGNQTFSVKYYANPGFAYPAGTYTTDVVYTATQL